MLWVVDTDVQSTARNVCLTSGSCYSKIPRTGKVPNYMIFRIFTPHLHARNFLRIIFITNQC